MPRGRGVQVGTAFGEDPPPKIWEGKKRLKFGAISDNSRLRSRISPERIHISKIEKVVDQLQPLPRWAKKKMVNFGPCFSCVNRGYKPSTSGSRGVHSWPLLSDFLNFGEGVSYMCWGLNPQPPWQMQPWSSPRGTPLKFGWNRDRVVLSGNLQYRILFQRAVRTQVYCFNVQ